LSMQARLLQYIRRYKWFFLGGAICSAISAGLTMLVAKIVEGFFDAMEVGRSDMLTLVCVSAIGLYIINWIFAYGQTYLLSSATNRVAADLRNDIYSHVQNMPLSFFDRTRTGHIISRIANDVGLIQNGAAVVIQMVRAPLIIVVGLAWMFKISWLLSLVAVIVVPVMALVISRIGRRMRSLTSVLQISLADLIAALEDTMVGVRIIKSFGMEDYEIEKFAQHNKRSLKAAMRGVKRSAAVAPTLEVLGTVAAVGVIWLGASLVQDGTMSIGGLTKYLVIVNLVSSSAKQLGNVNVVYHQTLAGADRVFEVLDEEPDLVEAPDAIELPPVAGKVEFRNVSFQYKEDTPVLKNVSFTMEPGKVLALVGPSGSGKSTTANLIPRFYDVSAGGVFVDGIDVRSTTLNSLRGQIGVVPQETILFTGTVKENISYGKLDASDEEIIDAAKAAHAHEFITHLNNGYDTVVGERGAALSGGERQRIAIARALLRDPRILILDEATSSLDATSEALVQKALERLMQGRTTLVIAHRLSTITKADTIAVLQDGRVVEKGAFKELLSAGGLFHTLYNTQFRVEEDSVPVT
jgi:ATP-binding cassette, subfamily B, bacterial MsbA